MNLSKKTFSKVCLSLITLLTISCAKTAEDSESVVSDVTIPSVSGACATANCSAGLSGKPTYSGDFATDCATLLSGGGASTSRSSSSTMTCANGSCGTNFSSWTDGNNNSASSIPVGTYAAATVFDHDSNFNGSPAAGDTVCCDEREIVSGTANITVSTCNDL